MELRKISQNKGQLGGLATSIISLVVAIIVLVLGLVMLQELRNTDLVMKDTTNASGTFFGSDIYHATNDSLAGLATMSDFVPLIVLAVAASIIIGLVLVGFAYTRTR